MDDELIAAYRTHERVMELRIGDATVARCRRHPRGWSVNVGGQQYETTTLDAVLDRVQTCPAVRRHRVEGR